MADIEKKTRWDWHLSQEPILNTDSPTMEDFELSDEIIRDALSLGSQKSYTENDLKNVGLNVKRTQDGEPYLDSPYGRVYLKNEPNFRDT